MKLVISNFVCTARMIKTRIITNPVMALAVFPRLLSMKDLARSCRPYGNCDGTGQHFGVSLQVIISPMIYSHIKSSTVSVVY